MRALRKRHPLAELMCCLLLAVLLPLVLYGGTARADETTNWCSQEPYPTGNDLFDVCSAGSGVLYAVGGLFIGETQKSTIIKSTDGGDNWQILSSGLGDQDVELRGVSAADAHTVWAVGSAGTILKTTNGGITWQKQASPTGEVLMDVFAVDAGTVWAVGFNGALIKTTNGTDWSTQTAPVSDQWLVGIHAIDSTRAWAVDTKARIIATTNGTNWAVQMDHSTNQESLWSIWAIDSNTVYAAGQRWGDNLSSIYLTKNGGSEWSRVEPAPSTRQLRGICATDMEHAWSVGNYGTILATQDGEIWSAQTSPTQYTLNAAVTDDTGVVWAVGNDGIIIRTGNGTDWESLGISFTMQTWGVDAPDVNTAYVTSSDIVSGPGKLYRTTDAGATWTVVKDFPEPANRVSAPSPGVAWVTGRSGSVWRIVEGEDPVNRPIPYDCWPLAVEALDAETVWLLPNLADMRIAKTADGGINWTTQVSPSAQALNDISAVDANNAFAVGYGGTIIRTTNGADWSLIHPSPTTQDLYSVSAVDADTVWVTGAGGTILKTEDGGATWDDQGIGSGYIQGVSAIDTDCAYAIAEGPLKTTDGGDTWVAESIPVFLPVNPVDISAPAPGAAWMVGSYSILHTHFISAVEPVSASPGSLVTIRGGGFGASKGDGFVMFGDSQAGGFGTWGDTEIRTYVPNGVAAGPCQVRVHNRWGRTIPVEFTVETLNTPHIDDMSPGSAHTGQLITLTGSDFGLESDLTMPRVSFGGTSVYAPQAESWSRDRVDVRVPAGLSPGPVQVRVTTHGGASNIVVLNVLNPPPTVASITPASGVRGTTVSVTDLAGTGLYGTPVVKLKRSGSPDVTATDVSVSSPTKVTCELPIPPGAATGSWNLFVQNPDGQDATKSGAFTVTASAPTVASITPASGVRGTTVSVTDLAGTGFYGTPVVKLKRSGSPDVTATDVSVSSPTKVTCELPIPPGAATGSWNLFVQNPDGQGATKSGAFTVKSATPVVTGVEPSTLAPGDEVAVTGSGFGAGPGGSAGVKGAAGGKGATAPYVSFAGVAATDYRTWTDAEIVCTAPEGVLSGDVTVVTASGTSNGVGVKVVYPTWYLAEGSTAWGFDCYITIQNPNDAAVETRITYMTDAGKVDGGRVALPPNSQTTVRPAETLGQRDFSTMVECLDHERGIAVDRTMTWQSASGVKGSHSSVGVTGPANDWFMPEGSSAWGFETWLLIQNPNNRDVDCRVTYMIEGEGPRSLDKTVPANSRRSFNMAEDIGSKDASIMVHCDDPVIPERAMYRNGRRTGHDSIGTTRAGGRYYLAEGTTAWGFTTYILIQNPNSTEIPVELTYMTDSGPVAHPENPIQMPAHSRKTVRVNDFLPGRDFSTLAEGEGPIITERAMYWNNGTGEAGHDSIGMPAAHSCFYLPDGETAGDGLVETWTLVQNPGSSDVTVEITYMTPPGGGNVTRVEVVPAGSRRTFGMAEHSGLKGRAAVEVRSRTAGGRIMVERAMYWNSRGAGANTIGAFSE